MEAREVDGVKKNSIIWFIKQQLYEAIMERNSFVSFIYIIIDWRSDYFLYFLYYINFAY